MRRTAWLQETRMERFEEAFGAWTERRKKLRGCLGCVSASFGAG